MADNAKPSKPDGRTMPISPSTAKGSVKGEPMATQRLAGGRLKLKPEAASKEPVEPPRRDGPVKPEGREPQPRVDGRKKAKPTGKAAAGRKQQASGRRQDELPDQVAVRRRGGGGAEQRGYVRFRMRMDDGKLSIVDSQFVDSPLMRPPTVGGNYAYEVTDGARLLHADSLPDLGVVRGFANPDGTLEQQRHHTYRESTYEFDVRVPAEELTESALPKVSVALYRVKDPTPGRPLTGDAPLGAQLEREVREVTRLSRIPAAMLPSELRPTRRGKASS